MTHQVQLSEHAYALLRRTKRAGESFSQVIERLCGDGKDPTSFIGGRLSSLTVQQRQKLADDAKGPVL